MITDLETRFSNGQTVAFAAGSANSTNVIDLLTTADISHGKPMRCIVEMLTALVGATATLQAKLVASAAADLSTPTTLFDTGAVAVATCVAGYRLMDVVVPFTNLEFIGIIYTVGTATTTAGTVFAGLVEVTETPIASRLVGSSSLS